MSDYDDVSVLSISTRKKREKQAEPDTKGLSSSVSAEVSADDKESLVQQETVTTPYANLGLTEDTYGNRVCDDVIYWLHNPTTHRLEPKPLKLTKLYPQDRWSAVRFESMMGGMIPVQVTMFSETPKQGCFTKTDVKFTLADLAHKG